MRVLLTGATGRIGEPVLAALAGAGHPVQVLTRSPLSAACRRVVSRIAFGDMTLVEAWVDAINGAEAVVHMAGVSDERPGALDVNVAGAEAMTRACLQMEVDRIVLVSSNCVLGHCDRPDESRFEFRYFPVDEDHPSQHLTDYGRSKMLAERVVHRATSTSELTAIALRPAWVWGEGERRRRRESDWKDHDHAPSLWAYVEIDDLSDAILAALTADIEGSFEAMYISAPDTTADKATPELAAEHYPDVAGEIPSGHGALFSSARAARVIGFKAERSWRQ